MTPEQTLDWLAEQHKSQCNEDRPVQEWIRSMKSMLPAPVQEPESFEQWNAKQHGDPEEIGFLQALRIAYCSGQDSVTKATSPAAQPAPPECQTEAEKTAFAFGWWKALESVRQPAVPDAFGTREGEHPQYVQGWNDCRAEMLGGVKP